MIRPTYETGADLDREWCVIEKVQVAWKCIALKLPVQYGLDFALVRDGQVYAFAEIKVRGKAYSSERIASLGGYMLSLSKWSKAINLYDVTGLPFFIIVGLSDGVFWAKFTHAVGFPIVWGGRADRGDWQDHEPCVLLPMDKFAKLDPAVAQAA